MCYQTSLIVVEALGWFKLHPELRSHPEHSKHDAGYSHEQRQLDFALLAFANSISRTGVRSVSAFTSTASWSQNPFQPTGCINRPYLFILHDERGPHDWFAASEIQTNEREAYFERTFKSS